MRDQTAWSFSLGRWLGLPIRVHMLVVLFGLVLTYTAWRGAGVQGNPILTSSVVLLGWLSALVIHELGHLFVTAHLGGEIRRLLVYPWGSDFESTVADGWSRFFVYLGGCSANFFAAAFGAVVAIAIFDADLRLGFFNPLTPDPILLDRPPIENLLRAGIWSNWMLGIINLTPAFLFDGGFLGQSLFQVASPRSSRRQILIHCSLVTQLFAMTVIGMAVIVKASGIAGNELFPSWFGLALFGLVLMFASKMAPADEVAESMPLARGRDYLEPTDLVGYQDAEALANDDRFIEFPSYEEFEPDQDESLSLWLKERQLERVEQSRQREIDEEKRADEILDKVHREGLRSLTADDKELLNRVSQRYRNRQREQA